jgi:hypothetical protein
VRVWLPDRPGALGLVASRIGAVGGDVTAIDILERAAGMAIDEFVVSLPDAERIELLVAEILEVDGVAVEEVRVLERPPADPRLEALEVAAGIVACAPAAQVLSRLAWSTRLLFDADWAAVVDTGRGVTTVEEGPCPPGRWLQAFVAGASTRLRASASAAGEPRRWTEPGEQAGRLLILGAWSAGSDRASDAPVQRPPAIVGLKGSRSVVVAGTGAEGRLAAALARTTRASASSAAPADHPATQEDRAATARAARGVEEAHAKEVDDVAWAMLDGADMAVVVGRSARPFWARERRQLAALARIADLRFLELERRELDRTPRNLERSRRMHPAAGDH